MEYGNEPDVGGDSTARKSRRIRRGGTRHVTFTKCKEVPNHDESPENVLDYTKVGVFVIKFVPRVLHTEGPLSNLESVQET